jgi:hypothetical protein
MGHLGYWMHWMNWREGGQLGDSNLFRLRRLYIRSDPKTSPSDLQCLNLSS